MLLNIYINSFEILQVNYTLIISSKRNKSSVTPSERLLEELRKICGKWYPSQTLRKITEGPIPFKGPVRLIHGMQDDAVPWEHSLRIADAMESEDVEIALVKDGEHRLSRDADLARLMSAVANVVNGD